MVEREACKSSPKPAIIQVSQLTKIIGRDPASTSKLLGLAMSELKQRSKGCKVFNRKTGILSDGESGKIKYANDLYNFTLPQLSC
jgi:hypothetical protein